MKKCFKMVFYTVFMLFFSVSISVFLRQTKNRSAENDFSFGAEKNSVMPKAMSASLRSRAETWLKDEGQFRKTLGREAA